MIEEQDHHYNPQFYLRGWVAPAGRNKGKLLQYQRIEKTGKLHRKWAVPKGTSFKRNLYAAPSGVDFESWDPQIIETDFMQEVDNDAAKVLPKILAGTSMKEDRRAWARYLNSLIHRHKALVESKDRWAERTAKPQRDKWIAYASDAKSRKRVEKALAHCNVEQMAKNIHRGEMVRTIDRPEALNRIAGLVWMVIRSDNETLLTTDRPLVIPCRGEQLTLTMAVSPTSLFVAHPDDGTEEEFNAVYRMLYLEHNSMLLAQGAEFVYASKPIEEPLLKFVEKSLAMPAKERDVEGRLPENATED